MDANTEHVAIVTQLELLNKQVAGQNSIGRMFLVGIVYGIGFFVGSAIIATIVFGIVAPFFVHIGWISRAFQTGLTLLGK